MAKCLSILVLSFQGFMLNKYLSLLYQNAMWWTWYVADVLVMSIWIFILFYLHRKFKELHFYSINAQDKSVFPEIKYSFIVWLSYVFFLCPRITIIFLKDVHNLSEKNLYGPNFLKTSLACTPIIFLLMVFGFHSAEIGSERKLYISSLGSSVAFDLFDSMDLLELLFDRHSVPRMILVATLFFACLNFTLPTLTLYDLHVNQFSGRVTGFSFKLVYNCIFIFLVNLPNLILRILLWYSHNSEISVLLMKNVIYIFLGMNEIIEYYLLERPKKCPNCKNLYKAASYNNHYLGCKIVVKKPNSGTEQILVHEEF